MDGFLILQTSANKDWLKVFIHLHQSIFILFVQNDNKLHVESNRTGQLSTGFALPAAGLNIEKELKATLSGRQFELLMIRIFFKIKSSRSGTVIIKWVPYVNSQYNTARSGTLDFEKNGN